MLIIVLKGKKAVNQSAGELYDFNFLSYYILVNRCEKYNKR